MYNCRFLARVENLNVNNVRERDIVFGLFNFYDVLIDRFRQKNNIKTSNAKDTRIMQLIVDKVGMTEKELGLLKNSEIMTNVDFDQIKAKAQNDVKTNDSEIGNNKNQDENKPKYYL